MLDAMLLGIGGTYPLPKRYLTSLYCTYNGNAILIDAGEGTQIAMKAMNLSPTAISTIAITHFHGDHTLGIPGVLLSMSNGGRTRPVTIIGPKGIEEKCKGLLSTTEYLGFDIIYKEINGDEDKFKIDINYYLNAFKVKHSSDVETYGFTVSVSRNREFQIEKIKKDNVPMKYWSILQKGNDVENYKADDYLGPLRSGLKICYSTDTRPCELLEKYANNSDLLVLEAMYLNDNYERAEEKAHMLGSEAIEIAIRAHAKKVWLTHFSPMITNDEIREFAEKYKHYSELDVTTKNNKIILNYK